jgi:hypothetical protein
MSMIQNLTVRGKTDGFGCQLNAKLSGIAYCRKHDDCYRYVHTPFTTVSHGWTSKEDADRLNQFIGIPDNRNEYRIDCNKKYGCASVYKWPYNYYTHDTLDYIREMYWSTSKPKNAETEMVAHIRRGDVQWQNGGDRRRRYVRNFWYNISLQKLFELYPDNYRLTIHSEGDMSEFESIMDGWSQDLVERTVWKLATDGNSNDQNNAIVAFHEMVTAKVLLGSKSGFSYCAGLYNEGDFFFLPSGAKGQSQGLFHWKAAKKLCD